jgi:hypothetical protein
MDAQIRARLQHLVREQREVQRRMFAAQSEAIRSLTAAVDAIRRMHDEMLPLFETLNQIDDTVEGTDVS